MPCKNSVIAARCAIKYRMSTATPRDNDNVRAVLCFDARRGQRHSAVSARRGGACRGVQETRRIATQDLVRNNGLGVIQQFL